MCTFAVQIVEPEISISISNLNSSEILPFEHTLRPVTPLRFRTMPVLSAHCAAQAMTIPMSLFPASSRAIWAQPANPPNRPQCSSLAKFLIWITTKV